MTRAKAKILWVMSSFAEGPAAKRFAALAEGLAERFEHALVAVNGDYSAESMLPEGAQWRRVEMKSGRKRKRSLVSLGELWQVRKLLNAERPDLLVTFGSGALEWLIVNRGPGAAPHVHFEEGEGPLLSVDDKDAKRNWARRRAFPGDGRLFVAAHRAGARAFQRQWGAPEDAVRVAPMGVDTACFARAHRARSGGPVRLGALGPLVAGRGLDRVLRIAAQLRARGRDVAVMIAGDGPERASLEQLAGELRLGERVVFTRVDAGRTSNEEAMALFEQMDIFINTPDEDQNTIHCLQAMASGLPIIGASVNDLKEQTAQENRIFVRPVEDEGALVAAAELLVADPQLCAALGGCNRMRAEAEHSLEAMRRRIEELFQELTSAMSPLMLPAPDFAPEAALLEAPAESPR